MRVLITSFSNITIFLTTIREMDQMRVKVYKVRVYKARVTCTEKLHQEDEISIIIIGLLISEFCKM